MSRRARPEIGGLITPRGRFVINRLRFRRMVVPNGYARAAHTTTSQTPTPHLDKVRKDIFCRAFANASRETPASFASECTAPHRHLALRKGSSKGVPSGGGPIGRCGPPCSWPGFWARARYQPLPSKTRSARAPAQPAARPGVAAPNRRVAAPPSSRAEVTPGRLVANRAAPGMGGAPTRMAVWAGSPKWASARRANGAASPVRRRWRRASTAGGKPPRNAAARPRFAWMVPAPHASPTCVGAWTLRTWSVVTKTVSGNPTRNARALRPFA